MGRDLVSVIVPAYNAEKYIANTLESVLKQTYPHFEIIVVDDASQDSTADIVGAINDDRIRLIRHKANKGPGAARNTALDVATGAWIATLDADDQWMPQRLEVLLSLVDRPGDGYFVSDAHLLCLDTDTGLRPWGSQYIAASVSPFNVGKNLTDLNLTQYIRFNCPGIKPLFPRHHIEDHNLRYNGDCLYGEDLEFYCHLFRTGLKLRLFSEPLYLYRIIPGSLSDNKNKFDHLRGVYDRLLQTEGFTKGEQTLLKRRMDKVMRREKSGPLLRSIKCGDLITAGRLILREPWLIGELFRCAPGILLYRWRVWRLGVGRPPKR